MRQYAITRTTVGTIPAGTVVEVIALALCGEGRTLIAYDGHTARLSNESAIELRS